MSMQTGGETTGTVMEETTTGEPPATGGQESSSGGALPGLPEVECRQEGVLTSTASTTPSIVTFHNDSGEVRRLYWLDTAGDRYFLLEYAPGQVEDWNSFVTHAFLVADEQDQCITIFVLDQEGEYEVSLY